MLGEVPDLAREVRALRLAVEEVEPKKAQRAGQSKTVPDTFWLNISCTRYFLTLYTWREAPLTAKLLATKPLKTKIRMFSAPAYLSSNCKRERSPRPAGERTGAPRELFSHPSNYRFWSSRRPETSSSIRVFNDLIIENSTNKI